MNHVPRPLIGLLVATVLFFALWIVALKPSSSSSGGSRSQGLGQYQSAINQAKASAAAQNRAATTANNTTADGTSTASATSSGAATTSSATAPNSTAPGKSAAAPSKAAPKTTPTSRHPATRTPATSTSTTTSTQRLNVVDRSLADHKVLALLFYNPAAADDQAVRQELGTIPTGRGQVVKLAIPLAEVANYPVVTNQVLIQSSPTLVIIDRAAKAFTLVGYATGFEIAHRVADALGMH